ncbi:peptidase M24, structural domain-containing protein [Fimicolochytrium jonesii]|uniref:peptidase M24, structural domain-containing protein n=1 Tax=Fimicolochytrium jonesii TaxID=1396493 RepID=UPI0022FE12DE|nr:peptidase M24, structural domain-containing protein [Fimicolochytrium jonesii]KAI8824126.1 peptidase M24, structural domain-containing protein [Fimicolochytrium jonesii]
MTTASVNPSRRSYAPLARENRQKVLKHLEQAGITSGVLYLTGMKTEERKWTDCEVPFRQESNFFYLTGVTEPDCHLVIDVASQDAHVFIPKFSEDHALWMGPPPTETFIKERYGVQHCDVVDNIVKTLESLKASKVHILEQEKDLAAIGAFKDKIDSSALSTAVTEARMIKSKGEIELMRRAAKISGDAHIALMKAAKPGKDTERQLQALFEYECFRNDGRYQAYTPIVASGRNGSVLHYIDNTDPIAQDKRDLLLVDAGCEYECYAADITRTFPIGGKFEGDWKTTYEIVLSMQNAVLAAIKPGVEWEDMHKLANRVAAEGLLKAGLIKGDLDTLIANHIPALFFPHGLGHSIGLDVHDVGGYPKGVPRLTDPGLKYLRMRRTLKPGMAVTVEPGIYFVDAILDKALADSNVTQYLDVEVVKRFRKTVGGVRIEDDVVVTETGVDNLTGWVPKEVADIEKVMSA